MSQLPLTTNTKTQTYLFLLKVWAPLPLSASLKTFGTRIYLSQSSMIVSSMQIRYFTHWMHKSEQDTIYSHQRSTGGDKGQERQQAEAALPFLSEFMKSDLSFIIFLASSSLTTCMKLNPADPHSNCLSPWYEESQH